MAIICQCEAVRERAIVKAIQRGAVTPDEVARQCRAGAGCGGCHAAIDELIARHSTTASACGTDSRRLVAHAG